MYIIMKHALFLTPLVALVLTFIGLTNVLAVTYDISGNGAGSNNQVNYNQQTNQTVNQSNQSNVSNNVDVNCNTGGNSASGNTGSNVGVNTGDCSSNVNIQNNLNSNNAQVGCCKSPTPKPSPSSSNPPVGGPGGGDGGSSSGGGSSASGGQTLGATGVNENLALLSVGMTMVLGGLWQGRRILGLNFFLNLLCCLGVFLSLP